jgi:hypothetical protein
MFEIHLNLCRISKSNNNSIPDNATRMSDETTDDDAQTSTTDNIINTTTTRNISSKSLGHDLNIKHHQDLQLGSCWGSEIKDIDFILSLQLYSLLELCIENNKETGKDKWIIGYVRRFKYGSDGKRLRYFKVRHNKKTIHIKFNTFII